MVFRLIPGPGGEAAVGAVVGWRFLVELRIFDVGQGAAASAELFLTELEKEVETGARLQGMFCRALLLSEGSRCGSLQDQVCQPVRVEQAGHAVKRRRE